MKNKLALLLCSLMVFSCAELQQVVNQLPDSPGVSDLEIASGLRAALDQGIQNQVSLLAKEDGFFKNELVKILLPEELQKVDRTLRNIGLGNLADEGLKLMNRAAEDAVSTATPIFVDAVKGIQFADARNILLGGDNAATTYLIGKTESPLYQSFQPIIQDSFEKVGADVIWNEIINRYNQIPLVQRVNPNLSDYVTGEALQGVYSVIALEEKRIRTDLMARSSTLLKRVFALQDQ